MNNLALIIVLGIFAAIGVATILGLAIMQLIILFASAKDRMCKAITAEKEHNTAIMEMKKERKKRIREKRSEIEDMNAADEMAKLEEKKTKKTIKTERAKFKQHETSDAATDGANECDETTEVAKESDAENDDIKVQIKQAKKEERMRKQHLRREQKAMKVLRKYADVFTPSEDELYENHEK